VWEGDLREAGSYSNPRTRLNWTQYDTRPNGPKIRCRGTVGRKGFYTKIMIAVGFDVIWT
jgi:hypothetical protein